MELLNLVYASSRIIDKNADQVLHFLGHGREKKIEKVVVGASVRKILHHVAHSGRPPRANRSCFVCVLLVKHCQSVCIPCGVPCGNRLCPPPSPERVVLWRSHIVVETGRGKTRVVELTTRSPFLLIGTGVCECGQRRACRVSCAG